VAVLLVGSALATAFLMTRHPRREGTVLQEFAASEDALTVKSLNRALAQGGMEGMEELIAQARRRSPERPQSPTLDDILNDIDF